MLVKFGLDGEHQGKKVVADGKLLLMPPSPAVSPMRISNLRVNWLLIVGYSLVVDLNKVILKNRVLVVRDGKEIHPRILQALADNRKSADPSEKVLLASVKAKELEKSPEKDTLITFDKVWPDSVLEIPDASVAISQKVSVEKRFVHGRVSYKSVFK